MKKIAEYSSFNQRRYSNPWIAKFKTETGKIDFSERVGGYTGRYGAGEEGVLYLDNPVEGAAYAYGQKDNRGGKTEINYIIITNGEIVKTTKQDLLNL